MTRQDRKTKKKKAFVEKLLSICDDVDVLVDRK